jgi:hypothetical protein
MTTNPQTIIRPSPKISFLNAREGGTAMRSRVLKLLFLAWVIALNALFCLTFLASINFLGIRNPVVAGVQNAIVGLLSGKSLYQQ